MPLWRVAVTVVLSLLFAIAIADVSPASASGKAYPVPSSIDATGTRDVSRELSNVIDSAPNGSTIVFRAGGTYRLDKALRVIGRRNLTLDGNGAQLNLRGSSGGFNDIGIIVQAGSTGTIIRDFTIVGNNSLAGTSDAYDGFRATQHAVAVLSSTDTLVADMDIRRVWGDCLYLNYETFGGAWNDTVTFRDSTCRLTGRHGVTIEGARRVRIERNTFDELGFMVVDIEPYMSDQGAEDVVMRDNTVGSYGLNDEWESWFFAACGHDGSVVRNVTITGNTVQGNRAGYGGRMLGLHTIVCGTNTTRENFTVTDNVARTTVGGPVMFFTRVKGVTVTGNTQPLSAGGLATFPSSTNVTYDG